MNKNKNGNKEKLKKIITVLDNVVCTYNNALDSACNEIVEILGLTDKEPDYGLKYVIKERINSVTFNNESNMDEEVVLYIAENLGIPEEEIPDRKYLAER